MMMAPVRVSALPPLLLIAAQGTLQAWAAMCPGEVHVRGHGSVSLVNAGWNVPGLKTGIVEARRGISVVPHMDGRTYFADTCTVGAYNHSQYTSMRLLDKTFRYTVDLSLAGCGCNAALYLTPLQKNSLQSDCQDYYCDANKVCGIACSEIDIQEANVFAWHTTAHAWDDGIGVGVGIGGNTATWTKAQYGPGAGCIDTLRPFQVAASFPVGPNGALRAIGVQLSQWSTESHRCSLEAEVASYPLKGRDGMAELSEALAGGMTPIISYWSSDKMTWMDGQGSNQQTDCKEDVPSNCAPLVMFYEFSLEDYQPPNDGCERCPVGSCDRTLTGECEWFDAVYLKGIHSYHCRVEDCSEAPEGPSYSTCWSWKGRHFFSVTDRDQPCRVKTVRDQPCSIGDLGIPCKASPALSVVPPPPGAPEPNAPERQDSRTLNQTLDAIQEIMMKEARGPIGGSLLSVGSRSTVAALSACLVGALIGIPAVVVALRARRETVGDEHTRLTLATTSGVQEDDVRDLI